MTAPSDFATRLAGRSFVFVRGPDAETLLENTISNSVAQLTSVGDMIHSGLLTPQGKILFAFFVVRLDDGFLLDTDAVSVTGLTQRLTMYRLRAKADIVDVSDSWGVVVASDRGLLGSEVALAACSADPRAATLGVRCYFNDAGALQQSDAATATYHDRRIAAGIADAVGDYELGDTFTHEANWDEIGSVDFKKGCFIGQEVVSRTRHKTVVRKRICRVTSHAIIPEAATIVAGDTDIGTILSRTQDARAALAMIRIDRAVTAVDKGTVLLGNGVEIALDPERIAAYQAARDKSNKPTEAAS